MNRKAFTLVELLVVIAIIALLVGILAPTVGKALTIARRAKCAAHLHAVSVAMRMYLNDSNDVMPVAAQMPSLNLNNEPRIADLLAPHLPDREALRCPADLQKDYFASEGSSYEYSSMLGGRKVGDSFLSKRWGESKVPVMYDYDTFHGPAGEGGAKNYLFADGHVGDME